MRCGCLQDCCAWGGQRQLTVVIREECQPRGLVRLGGGSDEVGCGLTQTKFTETNEGGLKNEEVVPYLQQSRVAVCDEY